VGAAAGVVVAGIAVTTGRDIRDLTFRPTVSTVFLEKPPVFRRRCNGGALAHGGKNALEGCLGVLRTASPGAEGYHCVWRSTKVEPTVEAPDHRLSGH
jgi:hypothetical protein